MLPRKLCLHFPASNSKMSGSQLEFRPSIHRMLLSGKALLCLGQLSERRSRCIHKQVKEAKPWTGRRLNGVTKNPWQKFLFFYISPWRWQAFRQQFACQPESGARSCFLLHACPQRHIQVCLQTSASYRAAPSEQRGFSLWPWHAADPSPQEPALRNPPWHWYQSPCVPLAAQGWGVEANAHRMGGFWFQESGSENKPELFFPLAADWEASTPLFVWDKKGQCV